MKQIGYLLFGFYFGIVLYKTEVISWFRIQEMFRFQSFHMYGIIGLAVIVGAISVQILRRFGLKSLDGEPLNFSRHTFSKGHVIGGLLFGLGWAMVGACPGPLYALVGSGYWIMAVTLLSAIIGVLVYGITKKWLPH
ncbi:MAG: transporter [Chitinophagales bacterium]|nr:MAG: transporter [Chitinophagales bacterium]